MAALVVVAQFLVALDGSLAIVALPSIGRDLELSLGQLAWVQNAYAVTLGACLVLSGRAADAWGPRRVFACGAALFGVAALAYGVAPSGGWVAAARGGTGVATAMVFPSGLAVLASLSPDAASRARAVGSWGTATAVSAPVGAVAGGALIEALGWRATALLGVAVLAVVPLTRQGPGAPRTRPRIGARAWADGLLVAVGTGVLVVWMSVDGGVALAGAVVATFAVCVVSHASGSRFVARGLLHQRHLVGSAAVAVLGGGTMLAMAFFLQQYLQVVQDMAPGMAGLAYAPVGLAFAVVARPVAALTARHGACAVVVSGFGAGAAALLLLSRCDSASPYWPDLLAPLLLTGAGLGLLFVGVTIAAVGSVGAEHRGVAGGLVNSAWQIGGAIGLSCTVAAVAFEVTARADVMAGAIRQAFELEAGIAGAAAVLAAVVLRGSEPASESDVDVRFPDRDGDGEARGADQMDDLPA